MGFLTSFFYSQLFVSLPKPTTPFTGKTVIVTGANTGLGFEAAKHIVGLNAKKVILACRNVQKGEAARQVIEDSTGRKNVVEVWHLDLDSYDSVKKFAARAGSELSRLDAVIENAGIMTSAFRLAEENESTITVNVISTFLLAMLLLPQLHKTQQKYGVETTLTIVASELHWVAKFPERESAPGEIFNTLNDKAMAQMGDRYPVSKLLEVLLVQHLASLSPARESGSTVTINCVNPGLCHSELGPETKNLIWRTFKAVVARTAEEGSKNLVAATTHGRNSHGQYVSDCKVTKPSPFVTSEEGKATAQLVWEELAQKLERIQPGILQEPFA